jgi:hypothetical protein
VRFVANNECHEFHELFLFLLLFAGNAGLPGVAIETVSKLIFPRPEGPARK